MEEQPNHRSHISTLLGMTPLIPSDFRLGDSTLGGRAAARRPVELGSAGGVAGRQPSIETFDACFAAGRRGQLPSEFFASTKNAPLQVGDFDDMNVQGSGTNGGKLSAAASRGGTESQSNPQTSA